VGDALDVVLVLAVLGFGVSGFRQGFVVGVVSFVGFLGGGVIGAKFAPTLLRWIGHGEGQPVGAISVVFIAAIVGQLALTPVGAALRRRLRWRSAELVDSTAGAVVSVIGVLLVSWLVGTAVAHSQLRPLARQVQHSKVLAAVEKVMPAQAQTWFAAFQRLFDENGVPQVFSGIGPESILPVATPDPKLVQSPAVVLARHDVLVIHGVAPSCRRDIQGTGFVFAPHRLMTNAHVVAGVRSVTVAQSDGTSYDAKVVLYDSQRDVAVLYVPDLQVQPMSFAPPVNSAADAVVVGYPKDGPFTPVAARVRERIKARGPNIYQSAQVTREIYSLYAKVQPGNSGGPLLTPSGGVLGVVFAQSLDDKATGYALTAAEVAPDAAKGQSATAKVPTGACTTE
jgi:S1-C subfamily serine protease